MKKIERYFVATFERFLRTIKNISELQTELK
jgi:hypothetical protein